MVIAVHTSDSTNTLVSLDNNHNANSKHSSSSVTTSSSANDCCGGSSCRRSSIGSEFQKTCLLLPTTELVDLSSSSSSSNSSFISLDNDNDNNDNDGSYGYCSCEEDQSVYLPATGSSVSVDQYLAQVPAIRETCDELLSYEHHLFTEASPEKVLYVHQGEVARALASQCDVLVTDKATTCHILAIRSSTGNNNSNNNRHREAMTSLTHIDGDQYEASIRDMIQAHKRHHGYSDDESLYYSKSIDMDIHILGGFADKEGLSQNISNWLLRLLATIANEEAACLVMRLKTCAISSLNDTGVQCPIGRGLAVHLRTGRVFLAKATPGVVGPYTALRNARLWSTSANKTVPKLHVIHTTTSNELVIQPFMFQPLPGMEKLVALPDDVLLEYTSTSPAVEEDDFCATIRTTLHFLREVSCHKVFGRRCNRPLRFVRRPHQHFNEWMLVR